MKCPDCNATISTKHFDADAGWYECPRCGGLHLPDEIEEAANGTSPRLRAQLVKQRPVAKSKKRKTEIDADAELLESETEKIVKKVQKKQQHAQHRDEIETRELVAVWADEIKAVYEELGGELDDLNARDKALTLWRDIRIQTHLSAREQEVPLAHCKEHA